MTVRANSEQIRLDGDPATERRDRKAGPGIGFFVIVLLIFGLLFAYLERGLATPIQETWVRVVVTGLMGAGILATLSLPLLFWRRDSERPRLPQRAMMWLAGGGMGILSFALVLLLVRDLASFVVAADLRTETISLLILAASAALFLLGFARAQYGVKLRHVAVPIENLPPEFAGLKILQISDLHVGPT